MGIQFQIIGQDYSKAHPPGQCPAPTLPATQMSYLEGAKEQNLKDIDTDIPKKDSADLQIESLKFFTEDYFCDFFTTTEDLKPGLLSKSLNMAKLLFG